MASRSSNAFSSISITSSRRLRACVLSYSNRFRSRIESMIGKISNCRFNWDSSVLEIFLSQLVYASCTEIPMWFPLFLCAIYLRRSLYFHFHCWFLFLIGPFLVHVVIFKTFPLPFHRNIFYPTTFPLTTVFIESNLSLFFFKRSLFTCSSFMTAEGWNERLLCRIGKIRAFEGVLDRWESYSISSVWKGTFKLNIDLQKAKVSSNNRNSDILYLRR